VGEFGEGCGPERDRVGRDPGPRDLLTARLVHEHSEAVDRGRSPFGRGAQQRRLERVIHDVDDDVRAVSNDGSIGHESESAPIPTEVVFTTMSAAAMAAGATALDRLSHRCQPRGLLGGGGVRFEMSTRAAPARERPSTIDRAAAPAPINTTTAPAGS
jgi:hypothetical protein